MPAIHSSETIIWCATPQLPCGHRRRTGTDNCRVNTIAAIQLGVQVFAAASFLLAQKMHLCSNSIHRIATFFVDACLQQLEGRHSVQLAQPLQKLSQLRKEYVAAKTSQSSALAELRVRWDTEHAVRCYKSAN